jgi:hypothetical protein
MILYVISGRAANGQFGAAVELVQTVGTYFPDSSVYSDEFGAMNQIYFVAPFDSLAAYEQHLDALRKDRNYMRIIEDGAHLLDIAGLEFKILRQV